MYQKYLGLNCHLDMSVKPYSYKKMKAHHIYAYAIVYVYMLLHPINHNPLRSLLLFLLDFWAFVHFKWIVFLNSLFKILRQDQLGTLPGKKQLWFHLNGPGKTPQRACCLLFCPCFMCTVFSFSRVRVNLLPFAHFNSSDNLLTSSCGIMQLFVIIDTLLQEHFYTVKLRIYTLKTWHKPRRWRQRREH